MKSRVIGILRLTVRLLMTVIRFLSGGRVCGCRKRETENETDGE